LEIENMRFRVFENAFSRKKLRNEKESTISWETGLKFPDYIFILQNIKKASYILS